MIAPDDQHDLDPPWIAFGMVVICFLIVYLKHIH